MPDVWSACGVPENERREGLSVLELLSESEFTVLRAAYWRVLLGMPSARMSGLSGVGVYWDHGFTVESGILGAWWWVRPDVLRLSPVGRSDPAGMVSILAHELHHRWQWERFGTVLYVLLSAPGVRRYTLEPSAYALEHAIDALFVG